MKSAFAFVSVCVAAISCSATTFTGDIVQTITSTNDPLYYLGETFAGQYTYNSSTIDGVFWTPPVWPASNENRSLGGNVFLTFPTDDARGKTQLTNTVYEGWLTIANGVVTDFVWTWELGGYYASFGFDGFFTLGKYDQETVPIYKTTGVLHFSRPVAVAERGSSLSYLTCGLVCMAIATFHRKWRRVGSAGT